MFFECSLNVLYHQFLDVLEMFFKCLHLTMNVLKCYNKVCFVVYSSNKK